MQTSVTSITMDRILPVGPSDCFTNAVSIQQHTANQALGPGVQTCLGRDRGKTGKTSLGEGLRLEYREVQSFSQVQAENIMQKLRAITRSAWSSGILKRSFINIKRKKQRPSRIPSSRKAHFNTSL